LDRTAVLQKKANRMAVLALHQFERPRQWQDHEVQLVITVVDRRFGAFARAERVRRWPSSEA